MRDLQLTSVGLRSKTIALSIVVALLALGGWAAALVRWHNAVWLVLGAVASIVAVLAAADLMSRLSRLVLAAMDAFQRVADGHTRVRMPAPPIWKHRDEADEFPASVNRILAELPDTRPRPTKDGDTDPVTGVYTHRHFHERLAQEIQRAERHNHVLSVLMIDLDNFRYINETLGHARGDDLLQEAARVISGAIRTTDLPARYGGDEFAVILPETGLPGALQVANKICAEVSSRRIRFPAAPDSQPNGNSRLTISIGAASYPQHSTRKDGLMMAADVAMYMAKHSGRTKVCPFNRVPGAREVTDPYQLYQFLQNSDWGALEALVAAVDARDRITGGHSKKVTIYAVTLARAIGLSEYDVEAVRAASLLHDVGKIGIPDRVLVKAGALSDDERALIQSHPGVGESLARRSLSLKSALPGILYHHERCDGKGYPTGLAGDDIPVAARIIAIADAYDAMMSARHYRQAPGRESARRELEMGAGSQWDAELVRDFLKLEAEGLLDAARDTGTPLVTAGR